MEVLIQTLFVLLGCCVVFELVHAQNQDQSGYISIDCGLPENSIYTDGITGINYTSDATYIDTGISRNISGEYNLGTLEAQYLNVRSFPEGKKNCFTLRPAEGTNTKYLIRASFMYGNYDGLNEVPKFDLLLGADLWDTVEFDDEFTVKTKEIIHFPPTKFIHVCLVNSGSGTPFISLLELRPLANNSYVTQSESLLSVSRLDIGSTTNQSFRYKDDMYDRIWLPEPVQFGTLISTSLNVSSRNGFEIPSSVMKTAIRPPNGSSSLSIYWGTADPTAKYYVYMHFAEIEELLNNQTREFNILQNGLLWYGSLGPSYLTTHTIYSTSPVSGDIMEFTINKTVNSDLPPILNAIEVYMAKQFQQLLTEEADVDAILSIKAEYGVKKNWQGDPCAPKEYLWEGLNCSYSDSDVSEIISLSLSSSGLTGEISAYIFNLKQIQSLDLSNNSLDGTIPDFLSQLAFLKTINLKGNNLTGSIPAALYDRMTSGSLSLSVDGNPQLCQAVSCEKSNNFVFPVVASVVGVSVLMIVLFILWSIRRRKVKVRKTDPKSSRTYESLELKNHQFTYSDILKITNNFERVLGKGGFGTVYHGYLDDTEVAVKMLSPSSAQGYKQFQAEVKLLMRVHHRNLTSLVGFCDEGTNMGLIYEYMANGNLGEHLSESSKSDLDWEARLRIAVEAAQGLEYLHNGCKPPIVHRDVKSSNILLNDKFQAKLADFGLSRIFPAESGTHVSTTIAGTPGYLDAEYYISNRLTEKSDVYSFGVVLLEIITSRPVIAKTDDHEKAHISRWVSFMLANGDIKSVVDPMLRGGYNINSVWKAIETAMSCLSATSTRRPTMTHVVAELNECLEMEIARKKKNSEMGTDSKDSTELSIVSLHSEFSPLAR